MSITVGEDGDDYDFVQKGKGMGGSMWSAHGRGRDEGG